MWAVFGLIGFGLLLLAHWIERARDPRELRAWRQVREGLAIASNRQARSPQCARRFDGVVDVHGRLPSPVRDPNRPSPSPAGTDDSPLDAA